MDSITKHKLTQFVRGSRGSLLVALVVATVVGISGFMFVSTRASGFFSFLEGEQGTANGNAQVVSDATASGGQAVQFNAPAAPPPPPPSGSTTCPLPAYPSASCTGVPAGTALTVVNGDMTITTANTVVDSKEIRGCVSVQASGVVIRKSKVAADCFYVVKSHGVGGTPLLIEDSEITCNVHSGTGVGDTNIVIRRSNIHGCENGLDVDGEFDIQDSYIHDLYNSAEAHSDGIQTNLGGNNITIRHNTIYSNDGTSSIIIHDDGASNTLIQDNLMAGGAYNLYCARPGASTNFRVIGNHFSTIFYPTVGSFGPWLDCEDEFQVTGNVYHETGAPVLF